MNQAISDDDAVRILDLVDSGVIMLNENQEITFWNHFISEASHISFDTIANKKLIDVFPSIQETRIDKAVQKAVNFNFPSILSYKLTKTFFPLYRKSLATKPPYLIVQSIIVKPIIKEGKNCGCIIYINDVSSASKREKDLNEQSRELQSTLKRYTDVKNQFRNIFDSAHNGVIIFNKFGVINKINHAGISILNENKDTIVGSQIDDLFPEIKEKYFCQDEDQYCYKDSIDYKFEKEIPSNNKYLSISVSLIDNDMLEENLCVFITDITEIKLAEKKLLTVNAELEEFAYRTSHDLRSPIVSAISLMEISKKSLKENDIDKVYTCMDHVEHSLIKLEALIKDIIKLTEAQNLEEPETNINLDDVTNEIYGRLSQLNGFETINKTLSFNHSRGLICKKTRINMILENIISNAIKYYDPNEESPSITIETSNRDSDFIIDVSDNGLGIPEEYEDKLFQMFKRFHPKVAFGSGLGLYLVKKSAEFLGGDIEYIPQAKGTHFRLTIPQNIH